eukprot:scaffold61075_cov36-Tisochrysis_lutea.AAC.2
MPSMSRPSLPRSDRPLAETTPAETVEAKPRGLPMATTSCPTASASESPSMANGRFEFVWSRTSARSVATSRPTVVPRSVRPSVSETFIWLAEPTTCALERR